MVYASSSTTSFKAPYWQNITPCTQTNMFVTINESQEIFAVLLKSKNIIVEGGFGYPRTNHMIGWCSQLRYNI